MWKILPLALILTATPAYAWVAQKAATVVVSGGQVLSSNATGIMAQNGTFYLPVGYSAVPKTTNSDYAIIAAPGNITSMRVRIATSPPAGQTWTVDLLKNGATVGLSCQVTSASSNICSATGLVAFVAGDRASWRFVSTASTGTSVGSVSAVWSPTTSGDFLMMGRAVAVSNSLTQASVPYTDQSAGTAASRNLAYVPDTGTIDRLYMLTNAPGTAGDTKRYTWSIIKNADTVTTPLNCPIIENATSCSDVTNELIIAGPPSAGDDGDHIQLQSVPLNTPAAATGPFGARIRLATPAGFPLMAAFPSSNIAGTKVYYPLSGGHTAGSSTESTGQSISDAMTIKFLGVRLNVAPSAGKSRVYTLRINGAPTSCTVTISGTALYNSAVCNVAISDDDLLSTEDDPTTATTATASTPSISYVATRP